MILLNNDSNVDSKAEMLLWTKTREVDVPSLFELFFEKGSTFSTLNENELGQGQYLRLSSIDYGSSNIPGPNNGPTFADAVKAAKSVQMALAVRNTNFGTTTAQVFNIIFNVKTSDNGVVQHYGTTDNSSWNCLANLTQSPRFELAVKKYGILPIVKKHLVASWESTETMYLFDVFTEVSHRSGMQNLPLNRASPQKGEVGVFGFRAFDRLLSANPLGRLRLRAESYPLGVYNLSVLKELLSKDANANICIHFGVISSSKYFFLPKFSPILEIKTNASESIKISSTPKITLVGQLTKDTEPIKVRLNATLDIEVGIERGTKKTIGSDREGEEFTAFPKLSNGILEPGSYEILIEISGFEITFPFTTTSQSSNSTTVTPGTPVINELTFLDFGGACPPACPAGVSTVSS